MERDTRRNMLFQTAHLTMLFGYTFFSVFLIALTVIMSWELWVIVPMSIGLIVSWILHIRQYMTSGERIWLYEILMMLSFFFYGIHPSSRFDLSIVMAAIITLTTMTGRKALVRVDLLTYVTTMGYNLTVYFLDGGEASQLFLIRVVAHLIVIGVIGWFSNSTITKWDTVVEQTSEEIRFLTDATTRLDDFLANVSHEIRTPVNAVVGLTDVCLERELDEQTAVDLTSVRTAGWKLSGQISDLLDYSEIDRGQLTINQENYSIATLMADVLNDLRPYIQTETELIIDVDPGIPSVMNGDVAKLKRILWHVIMNGLKFTKAGGVYMRMITQEEEYGVNLCIDVSDTGVGMTEEQKRQVFERFYQADGGRARGVSGLGLGLSIVHGFVKVMGGFLTFESEAGVGTTVHICIPQKVIDSSPCMTVRDKASVSLGAFFAFKKYSIPVVREYYGNLIRNIVEGMGVQLHGVDSIDTLKSVVDSVELTHIFIGMKEYETDIPYIESIAKKIPVFVTADRGYQLPPDTNVRFFEKPLYCFPVIKAINATRDERKRDLQLVCRGTRALVVDDEKLNLIVATGILKDYGMDITTAGSGMEAIEICKKNTFDIIFMDYMMPELDGIETMKRIRPNGSKARTKLAIVALTANTVSSARDMFMREGFDGFIGKPIDRVELERVLKNVLPEDLISYEEKKEKPARTRVRRPSARRTPAKPAAKPESPRIPKPEPVGASKPPEKETVRMKEATPKPAPVTERKPEPVKKPEQEKKPAPEASLTHMEKLKKIGIDVDTGMEFCQNDEDFYEEILMDFITDLPDVKEFLEEKLLQGNLKDYEIKVHSLKGMSKMIGAMEHADLAKGAEDAAREGALPKVREENAKIIEKYDELAKGIRDVLNS